MGEGRKKVSEIGDISFILFLTILIISSIVGGTIAIES
jgi:hypothetical protein